MKRDADPDEDRGHASHRPLGRVTAVSGSVVDIAFPPGALPPINTALDVQWDGPHRLIVEVQQHVDLRTTRGVAMQETDTSFMKTIENVKSAEQKASSLKQEAEKSAEKITRSTKRKAEELRLKGEKDALDLKEKIISDGKKATEKDVIQILSVAEKKASDV